jgi:hypothetical protein
VIVTGGASGIGLASAQALAAVGRPVALWDINKIKAEAAAKAITAEHGVATLAVGIDLRDLQALGPALTETRRALSPIGGLVHAAGVVDSASLEGVTPESWDAGINTHLRPLILMVQAMLEDFKANPGSAVVAISSINATLGNAMNPIYTAAKGGVTRHDQDADDAADPRHSPRLFRAPHPDGADRRAGRNRPGGAFPAVRRGELYHRRRTDRRRGECFVAEAVGLKSPGLADFHPHPTLPHQGGGLQPFMSLPLDGGG